MSALLDESRRSFGSPPRAVAVVDNLVPPRWMRGDDSLRKGYERAGELLATGDVVWGHVVQASSDLFRPGTEALPAQIVFPGSHEDVRPEELRRAARAAMALKAKVPLDPALAVVARALAAELAERHPALDLPNALSHGRSIRLAILVVHRSSLPSGYLSSSYVPLLASSARDAAMIFPSRYWADDLKRGWSGLSGVAP